MITRIAMWSGPRNISTALMRSFGNRDDTLVSDEPFYAHYLCSTGIEHPGRKEILAQYETDWRAVTRYLTGPLPTGKTVWYQKHMAHHMLDSIGKDWLQNDEFQHVFLIRHPREVIVSLSKVLPSISIEQTGLRQQVAIFDELLQFQKVVPTVVDSRDILLHPQPALQGLCQAIGITFDSAMLRWRSGTRSTDGIWAKYWYASVEKSTGFTPYQPQDGDVAPKYQSLLNQCQRLYEHLAEFKLAIN